MRSSIFEIPEPAPLDTVNGDLPATESLPSEQQVLPTTTGEGEGVEMEQEMTERNQTLSTSKYVKVYCS